MHIRTPLAGVIALATILAAQAAVSEEIVVYSSRIESLIKPVFDQYTEETGVKVKYITDREAPLMARLRAEGANTPADMFITVDAGNLWQAEQMGILQPFDSEVIKASIPGQYRSSTDSWTGLSLRARTLVYSTERVDPQELSTYEALADETWKNRLCLRTSKKVYNQSLTAILLEEHGVEKTEQILKGWVDNLATTPFSDDTALMKAIDAGQCDVGIVNSYYFGRLLAAEPDVKVKIFWPNQEDRGVHVNLSGAGITKHAPNPQAAQKMLEWLTGEKAQYHFASVNREFPASPAAGVSEEVAAWGEFKADDIAVEVAGKRQAEAVRLMDRVGWR